jgi:hypothetical protein
MAVAANSFIELWAGPAMTDVFFKIQEERTPTVNFVLRWLIIIESRAKIYS